MGFIKKILLLSAVLTISINPFSAFAGISPSSLKLKIYKFAVSTSPYCTNLITVVDNGISAVETDFVNLPDLGSGVLADGTYPCVVIEMSDNVKFTPNATSGSCDSAVESTIDICRTDNGGTSTLVDGSAVTCTGTDSPFSPIANKVAMYISTASTGGSDTFHPPTAGSTTHGLTLGSALVVSGTSSGQFKMNASNQVDGTQADCGMNAPSFSFSKL